MDKKSENPFSQANHWNSVSPGYPEVADLVMKPFSLKAIEIIQPGQNANALDVACGSGTLSLPLSQTVAKVTALDFSQDMLNELEKIIHKKDITNIHHLQGDGQNLPFKDNSFDTSFSLFGLMFFPNRIQGFKELYRTLKPGKQALISSWAPLEKSSLMTLISEAVKAAAPDIPSPRKNAATLEDPELFKKEMLEGGFKEVEVFEVTQSIPPISPADLWRIMSQGGPLVMLKSKVSSDEWNEISEKATDFILNKVGSEGVETNTTALFGIGRK